MIVLLVTEGDFLLLFFPEGLAVGMVVQGGGIPHGISICTALQRAAKPDQITCKTTIPTMVPSKIRASHISTDSAVARLGGETELSFFFPACRSSRCTSATSRASASICAWVGYGSLRLEASRRRAVWASVCRSRFSRALLCSVVTRYNALIIRNRLSHSSLLGQVWAGVGCEAFLCFNSSMDNLRSDSKLMFHDLLSVFFLVEPVIPALHSRGCGVGDVLPAVRPPHLIPLTLHQRDEFLLAGSIPHALVDGVHEPELPALALGGGAVLPGAHPLLLDLLLRRRKDLQTVGSADLIVGHPVGLQVGSTLVEFAAILKADAVYHQVAVEMVSVDVGRHQYLEVRELTLDQFQRNGVGLLGR